MVPLVTFGFLVLDKKCWSCTIDQMTNKTITTQQNKTMPTQQSNNNDTTKRQQQPLGFDLLKFSLVCIKTTSCHWENLLSILWHLFHKLLDIHINSPDPHPATHYCLIKTIFLQFFPAGRPAAVKNTFWLYSWFCKKCDRACKTVANLSNHTQEHTEESWQYHPVVNK